jgi:hypothetical protein
MVARDFARWGEPLDVGRKTRTIPPGDPACAQCPPSRVPLRVLWEKESAARTDLANYAFRMTRRVAKLRPVRGE